MGRLLLLLLLVAAGLTVQGCFPYTSNYKPDPSMTTVRYAISPDAPIVRSSRLKIDEIPSTGQPDRPISVRAVRTVSGPGLEITSTTEQQYKNLWAPLIMPVGWLGVAMTPIFVLVSPAINAGPPHPNKMTVFGGWNEKGCQPGLILMYLNMSIGNIPTCQSADKPRVTESSRPLGRDTTEESPFPGAKLRVALAEAGATATTQGLILETGADGVAAIPLIPLFLDMPDSMRVPEAVVSLENDPSATARIAIPSAVVEALAGRIRAEREGDRAAATGKGLIALEHYTRAEAMAKGTEVNPALWKKIVSTYRALPVKPSVSEETRRLLVQAETLAKTDNAAGAIEKLSEVTQNAPWLPVARYNMAMAQAMNGDYGAAVNSMNIYLELAPDAPDGRQAKDKIYEWETLKAASPSQATGGSGRNRPAPSGSWR